MILYPFSTVYGVYPKGHLIVNVEKSDEFTFETKYRLKADWDSSSKAPISLESCHEIELLTK